MYLGNSLEMIPENFESCPLITATVLEFPVIASRSPVIPEGCITASVKAQETFPKTAQVNISNRISIAIIVG